MLHQNLTIFLRRVSLNHSLTQIYQITNLADPDYQLSSQTEFARFEYQIGYQATNSVFKTPICKPVPSSCPKYANDVSPSTKQSVTNPCRSSYKLSVDF